VTSCRQASICAYSTGALTQALADLPKALQRVLGATADGAIGPKTLAMVPDHDPKDLIEKIYEARQHFYKNLSTFATFGKGWTRRNKETLEIALSML
jgi:lysozyme family protein